MRSVIDIESGGDPNARTGSYSGLFQMSADEAARYGNTVEGGTARLQNLADNFRRKYGREPSHTEIYLAHQQGEGGLGAHLANPDAPAWQNMAGTAEGRKKGEGWAKQAIWGNVPADVRANFPGGVDSLTSRQFMDLWNDKVGRRLAKFGGQPEPTADAPPQGGMLSAAQPPAVQGGMLAQAPQAQDGALLAQPQKTQAADQLVAMAQQMMKPPERHRFSPMMQFQMPAGLRRA